MQLLLLTVGLALICGLQAQEGNHEEPQGGLEELSGRWHSVALASNKSDLIKPWGHFRVFIHSMSAKDGNLHGDILIPQDGQCEKVSLTAFKTATSNKFDLEYWGHNDLYLAEVDPKSYLILYMINQYNDDTSLVAHLMVRDLSRQQDFLPAFESVCEDIGLHKDQIVVLSDDGEARCPPAHPHPLGPLRSVATQQAGARQALTPGHCAPQIAARVPETRASAHAGE
uniref:Minor allergen Can f 2 n=2 Tax=Canis lupus familiaris TaxID=9615 RepID=A0A8C0PQX3_CANLF